MIQLRFLGGAGTVTGSRLLVESRGRRLLLDAGLLRGVKQLRQRNRTALPVPAASIGAVVLTSAHIDHCGFLPRLVELGFQGKAYATPATVALCRRMLPDTGRLLEADARRARDAGASRHAPALPLYGEDAARRALQCLEELPFGEYLEPLPGFELHLRRAGHLPGAASVHLRRGERSILFSGSLGRADDPVMRPPAAPAGADWVIVESTYGDRATARDDPYARLAEVVSRTASRGGVVLVPASPFGPAQAVLHALRQLKDAQRIPDLPVYLDSPLAADLGSVLARHTDEHRLSPQACQALGEGVTLVNDEPASQALAAMKYPGVIVAPDGMATHGRAVFHLAALAPDPRNTIVLAGFQAAGTRGAALVRGAAEVKAHGRWVPVRAEVACLDELSPHAGRDDLLDWLAQLPRPPLHVHVVHGEPHAADALRQAIEERHGWPCSVPEPLAMANL